MRGHGPGQEVLQTGKKDVDIVGVEPVGSYAIQPRFSDGHDTGIYSWDYLYELGVNRDRMWRSTCSASRPPAQAGGRHREQSRPPRPGAARRADPRMAGNTHFGFEQVPEDEKARKSPASSRRSRRSTT